MKKAVIGLTDFQIESLSRQLRDENWMPPDQFVIMGQLRIDGSPRIGFLEAELKVGLFTGKECEEIIEYFQKKINAEKNKQ